MENLITVYTEAPPNPESLKFVASKMILPNDSADYRTADTAGDSPLATALFELPFVKGVFIMNNFVTITKNNDYTWQELQNDLRDFIKDWLESGKVCVEKKVVVLTETEESEIVTRIKQLLEDHVKPAVEMDGGAIDFKSFESGVVTVQLKGSCSGCPSSTMTLKGGIENLLKRMVPEVIAVEAEAA